MGTLEEWGPLRNGNAGEGGHGGTGTLKGQGTWTPGGRGKESQGTGTLEEKETRMMRDVGVVVGPLSPPLLPL